MQHKNFTKLFYTLFILFSFIIKVNGQSSTRKVLFLGNSYTQYNNLPLLLTNIALSIGDTVQTDANTPGGFTLMGHSKNEVSLAKINSQKWDYVVLQEQSQLPAFPSEQVENQVFPYARALDSLIKANNSCTKTIFYMTWGRKNGDAQNCPTWPPVCTYAGMDSLLALRYRKMADDNKALLSPVGAVWKYLRANSPSIELYNADESHPSLAGSYAAACCFYTILFKKDPSLINYNAGLSASEALAIKAAVKTVVYNQMANWNIDLLKPEADFVFSSGPVTKSVQFVNASRNALGYLWEFGDGDTSTQFEPLHIYQSTETYKVKLIAFRCAETDTMLGEVTPRSTGIIQISLQKVQVFPNPFESFFYVKLNEAQLGQTYKIYNATGNLLMSEKIEELEVSINFSELQPGIYFLKLGENHYRLLKK